MARKISWETRAEAYRMLVRGRSAKTIGADLGVDMATVKTWGNLASMCFVKGRLGGVEPVSMDAEVPQRGDRSYRRLTLRDRVIIQTIRETDPSISTRQIARRLGVNASTVSREFKEHRIRHWRDQEYDAELAHYRALSRRRRVRLGKLENPALREGVVSRLNKKFSPEQIAGVLAAM